MLFPFVSQKLQFASVFVPIVVVSFHLLVSWVTCHHIFLTIKKCWYGSL